MQTSNGRTLIDNIIIVFLKDGFYHVYGKGTAKNWNEINWKQCYENLEELQYNILIAYRDKDRKLVEDLSTEIYM